MKNLDVKPLALGVRFCPRPPLHNIKFYKNGIDRLIRRIRLIDFFSDDREVAQDSFKLRIPSRWTPDISLATIRCHETISLIKNLTNPILRRHDFLQRTSKSFDFRLRKLKKLKDNVDIKITQSDKNLGLVVQSLEQYHSMVRLHLSNVIYQKQSGHFPDSLFNWNITMKRLINEHSQLFDKCKKEKIDNRLLKFVSNLQTNLPVFHVLPKLHKPGKTGRPIVGAPAWITTNWSKMLDHLLQTYKLPHVLFNSIELVKELEFRPVPAHSFFVTCDVSSLYTNIDLDRLFSTIANLTKSPILVDILQFICKNNFFRYGNFIYHQLNGIAMGTNCAVQCANIYLHPFDMEFAPRCLVYRRYIDDILFIFEGEKSELSDLLVKMNSFIEGIKLTWSISRRSLPFLDLLVSKSSLSTIKFSTYQKDLNTYQYLPPFSCHPRHCLTGFIVGELLRYCRTNTSLDDRGALFRLFYQRLLDRGYPRRFLQPTFAKVSMYQRYLEPSKQDSSKTIALVLPFRDDETTYAFKRAAFKMNEHEFLKSIDRKIIIAFKKNKNILALTSQSNISDEQHQKIQKL